MVYPYVITLKNKNNRFIDWLGIILSIFSIAMFTREMVLTRQPVVAYLVGVIAIVIILIWNLIQSSKKGKVYYSRALLVAALVWMKMPYLPWLAFVFIILALLEYQAKHSVEIGFSDSHILINSLIKKRFQWYQFNNIILRDGLLTMDFTNNKVLQQEVEDDEDDDADEDEFNEYCRKQLTAHGLKPET